MRRVVDPYGKTDYKPKYGEKYTHFEPILNERVGDKIEAPKVIFFALRGEMYKFLCVSEISIEKLKKNSLFNNPYIIHLYNMACRCYKTCCYAYHLYDDADDIVQEKTITLSVAQKRDLLLSGMLSLYMLAVDGYNIENAFILDMAYSICAKKAAQKMEAQDTGNIEPAMIYELMCSAIENAKGFDCNFYKLLEMYILLRHNMSSKDIMSPETFLHILKVSKTKDISESKIYFMNAATSILMNTIGNLMETREVCIEIADYFLDDLYELSGNLLAIVEKYIKYADVKPNELKRSTKYRTVMQLTS